MSRVLWANYLLDGVVVSDRLDKPALYRHIRALDKLSRRLGCEPFSALCDGSGKRVAGPNGPWCAADKACAQLMALQQHLEQQPVRFGWWRDDSRAVLAELQQSIDLAWQIAGRQSLFNFSVVL